MFPVSINYVIVYLVVKKSTLRSSMVVIFRIGKCRRNFPILQHAFKNKIRHIDINVGSTHAYETDLTKKILKIRLKIRGRSLFLLFRLSSSMHCEYLELFSWRWLKAPYFEPCVSSIGVIMVVKIASISSICSTLLGFISLFLFHCLLMVKFMVH